MKYHFFAILLMIISGTVRCSGKETMLQGYIGVEGGELFSYKIVFTDSAGLLKGYSLTYLQEAQETRSAITGYLDKANHTLSFKETTVTYNHGFHSNATMCLIDVTLKYITDNANSGHILKGTYKSADASNTSCGTGSVTFMNDDVIRTLFDGQTAKDTTAVVKRPASTATRRPAGIKVTEISYPIRPAPVTTPVEKKTEEITAGVEKIYQWHTDTVVIDIWDGGTIDGDRISLLYNGRKVLDNYLLTATRKQLRLAVSWGTNVISIVANNEGSEPPNTANVLLTDGEQNYNIVAYNDVGHEAVIKIERAR